MIDERYQKQGYGRSALLLFIIEQETEKMKLKCGKIKLDNVNGK